MSLVLVIESEIEATHFHAGFDLLVVDRVDALKNVDTHGFGHIKVVVTQESERLACHNVGVLLHDLQELSMEEKIVDDVVG